MRKNNKRKRKALAAGIYYLSILPEFVLLAGTFLAARGQDGYVYLVNVSQKKDSGVGADYSFGLIPKI